MRRFDWVLNTLILMILALGMATFFAMGPDAHQIFIRHGLFILLGIAVYIVAAFLDYRVLKNYAFPSLSLYILAVLLLGFALASREIRGSSAWLELFGFRFEPSEFAKLALLILLAKYFSQKHIEIYRTYHIIVSGLYVALPLALTFLQPDLGSVIVYAALWISMLLFAGIKRRHLLAIAMIATMVVSLGWLLVLKPYQKDRIVSFINPYLDPRGNGYNTIQSRVTLGSGRVLGTFLTKGNSKIPVLVPEPYTDFTFATFGQKFGYVGLIVLLLLVFLMLYRIGSIGIKADNNFAKLYSLGLMTILFTHVVINGGMNLGVLPITGIPFPLLSHGGSHLVTMMAGLGIIQSIKRRSSLQ